MENIIQNIRHINDIFHTKYVYKSVVVCQTPFELFYMYNLLKSLDYPVYLLTHESYEQGLLLFTKHRIRMLIMTPIMYEVISRYQKDILKDCNYIFDTTK